MEKLKQRGYPPLAQGSSVVRNSPIPTLRTGLGEAPGHPLAGLE